MTQLIKIINVDFESKSASNGRTYEVAEVIYDSGGQKKDKKIMSFVNPLIFKQLKNAKKGDLFTLTQQKNDKGYWDWISLTEGSADKAESISEASQGRQVNATPARTYETAEERAERQRLIVRQSSLSAALATLSPGAKGALDPNMVVALAEVYTSWVFTPPKFDIFDADNDLGDVPL